MVLPKQQHTNTGDTDVYNLLNESDNKEDKSEYYDHARPVPFLSVMEEGYGSLFVEQGDNENYSEVDGATNHLDFGNILGKIIKITTTPLLKLMNDVRFNVILKSKTV